MRLMSRIYANNVDADIRASLNVLIDNSTSVGQYKDAFVSLGYRLAERFMA